MSQTTEEIRDTLTFILNKLQTIDTKLERQEDDIKAYIARGLVNLDSNELLIAGLKSTRTSFELFIYRNYVYMFIYFLSISFEKYIFAILFSKKYKV